MTNGIGVRRTPACPVKRAVGRVALSLGARVAIPLVAVGVL
ncbi:MAG TPA: hypothetical protein VM076_09320 [Gemmatimonadaceae bacterium]|nr:hypothetical protein [Gemmatimonadaceae bacterium]